MRRLASLIMAFVRRDARIATSYKLHFALQLFGGLFTVVMFYFIAKMTDPNASGGPLSQFGTDYFSFVLVGIVATGFLQTGVGLADRLRVAMGEGSLEMMFACPVRPIWILILPAIWELLFQMGQAVVMIALGVVLFGADLSHANWPAGLVLLLATVAAYSVFGILSTGIILVIKRGDPIRWLVTELAALVAGAYFPVALLPDWLERIAAVLPMTYAYHGIRMTVLKGAGLSDVSVDLAVLVGFAAIGLPLAAYCCHLAIGKAKRDGLLGSF